MQQPQPLQHCSHRGVGNVYACTIFEVLIMHGRYIASYTSMWLISAVSESGVMW